MLNTISTLSQFIIAIGLMNVWIFRFNKETPYRGGIAKTMIEEFAEYNLPPWSCYVIGFLKITASLFLLAGVKFPQVILPSAVLILILMLTAFTLHIMIRDPIKKALPAFSLLVLSGLVVVIQML
jgi:uncharacterized membrane protein YphA (DoxX/SURF4 family)